MTFWETKIEAWPSRDHRPIAVLRPEPGELGQKLSITFRDDRDDLDELRYAGLRLSGGDQILLVRHRRAPRPGTEVHADAGSDGAAVLQRFLCETGVSPHEVTWQLAATGFDRQPSRE